MKYLFKKYWYLMVIFGCISLPIFLMGIIFTDKAIVVKGSTSEINNVVDVDYDYKEEGSFSSIFVISMEHSTVLQNLICGIDDRAYVYEMSSSTLHFSNAELNQISKIQYLSAHQTAIIKAYTEAAKLNNEIKIDYKYQSISVTYYSLGSNLRIGDEIIAINGYTIYDNFDEYKSLINNRSVGMIFTVNRDGQTIEITINEADLKGLGGYTLFDINYNTIYPQISSNIGNSGGPSGGFMKTLSVFNKLTEFDYSLGLKIAGTGTIGFDGSVGKIGGIKQKIYAAFDDEIDIFFCPETNYEEALIAYNSLKNKERMALVMVKNFTDAIEYLENV